MFRKPFRVKLKVSDTKKLVQQAALRGCGGAVCGGDSAA